VGQAVSPVVGQAILPAAAFSGGAVAAAFAALWQVPDLPRPKRVFNHDWLCLARGVFETVTLQSAFYRNFVTLSPTWLGFNAFVRAD
jgi:hypothetical protein